MVQKSLLYIIAVILVIGWVLGFFYWHVGHKLIHILLLISLIFAAVAFFRKEETES